MIPYEEIGKDLRQRHSLFAFEFLLDNGREFTFIYNNREIGVVNARIDGNVTYQLCDSEKDKYSEFSSAEELVRYGKIDSREFIKIWNELELDVMG